MEVGCMNFGMTQKKKKAKRYARDNGLEDWNEVAVWQEFKLSFISGDIWTQYIDHETSERFARCLKSNVDNRNQQIHGSMTTYTDSSISFSAQAKRMVRLI